MVSGAPVRGCGTRGPLDSGNQGRADLAPGEGPAVARKVNPRTFGFQESRERSRLVLVSLSHPTPAGLSGM